MKNKIWIIVGLLVLIILAIFIPFFMTGFATGNPPEDGVDPSTLITLDTSNNPNSNFNDCVTIKDFKGEKNYDISSMKSGTVSIKGECEADLSGLLGGIVDLKVKKGVSISRKEGSDNYVLKSTGNATQTGTVNFGGETFILRKGDQLTINKDGAKIKGHFMSPKGEHYDNLAGFSVIPTNGGEVYFDMKGEKPLLSLPDGSSIEHLMSVQDFRDRFGDIARYDIVIKGNGLIISDDLSKEIAGGFADNRFKTFDGSLEFSPAKMRYADLPEKYFVSIPANEGVYFPNVGVRATSDEVFSTPLLFEDIPIANAVHLKDKEGYLVGKDNSYYLDNSQPYGFLALGKDSIFSYHSYSFHNAPVNEVPLFTLSFDPGTDYAGFEIPTNGRFIYESSLSEASFKDGQISFIDTNPYFVITNGPDTFRWAGSRGELGLRKQNLASSSFKMNIKGVNPISGVSTKGDYPSFAFSENDINRDKFRYYFIYGKHYNFGWNDYSALNHSKEHIILLSPESDGSQETIYFTKKQKELLNFYMKDRESY